MLLSLQNCHILSEESGNVRVPLLSFETGLMRR
jgi:hypothetical protein